MGVVEALLLGKLLGQKRLHARGVERSRLRHLALQLRLRVDVTARTGCRKLARERGMRLAQSLHDSVAIRLKIRKIRRVRERSRSKVNGKK